ncbi:NUDIX hydrolase domain-like protein [Collybia nuda]|uniref:NAD(+) diphosphatase n=1 Tax=Collybia nuda TaxID=64659 RepID=A0A9P6CG04_9AGAR|nr:NUDIX hydrolase domain-like protein [Collybia nuda]
MGGIHVNMFAGSPLNRLSWLRPSQTFLNAIIASPATRWLLFNSAQPLVIASPSEPAKQVLAYLTTSDVKPLLGPEPFFGQGEEQGQVFMPSNDAEKSSTEAARHRNARVVFLGLQESSSATTAIPSAEFIDANAFTNLEGTPFFSLDVADLKYSPEQLNGVLQATSQAQAGQILSWSEPRVLMSGLDSFSGAIFAEARSLVDWNQRNKFCPGCGSPTYSMWGGWKLACVTLLPWADNTGREPCLSAKGLHNFCHPRTDPVVIMLAVDETGEKVLLGRGKRFPPKFYSALAGFVEPAETFEDAVLREFREEVGVTVSDMQYHSGQPWPYPASLMLGWYVRADASHPIRTDLDNELVDARWYSRAEILSVLGHGALGGEGDRPNKANAPNLDHFQASDEGQKTAVEVPVEEAPFTLPPATTLAGVMIRNWADGKIVFGK